MKKTEIKCYVIFVLILSIILVSFTFISTSFGLGTPKLVSTMEKAFENILKISNIIDKSLKPIDKPNPIPIEKK